MLAKTVELLPNDAVSSEVASTHAHVAESDRVQDYGEVAELSTLN